MKNAERIKKQNQKARQQLSDRRRALFLASLSAPASISSRKESA
jgi:hypothetical protein